MRTIEGPAVCTFFVQYSTFFPLSISIIIDYLNELKKLQPKMMEKLSIFFIFHEFFTEFIFIFRVVYAEHIFLFTKLYRGENQKVFLYITVTNIKGDFFPIFNFKKKILFIGHNRPNSEMFPKLSVVVLKHTISKRNSLLP